MKISNQNPRNVKSIAYILNESLSSNEDAPSSAHHSSALHPHLKNTPSDTKSHPTKILTATYLSAKHPSGRREMEIIGGEISTANRTCNCKRSNCLKLYCDCFANGEYCKNCNCTSCYNNPDNETLRSSAIRTIVDRNPSAFRPKIDSATPSSVLQDSDLSLQKKHNKVTPLLLLGLCL